MLRFQSLYKNQDGAWRRGNHADHSVLSPCPTVVDEAHQRCVIERRRAATTVRSCDACELSFAPMTMTLTAILQNCMRILQLLLRRDMDARTPLPTLRNKTDPSVRRIRWTSRCHSARFLSSSGVLFSSLGRLSNCARDGTKSNRALAAALAESVPCIAALSLSYQLKLVARKSKYIEHIHIQPATTNGM